MAYNKVAPLTDVMWTVFNPSAGSASGSHAYITVPFKGYLMEAGFNLQTSIATGNVTFAANIVSWTNSTTSTLNEVVSSANVSFNSVMLIQGSIASTSLSTPAYCNAGDVIRLTTSGGNAVTTGATEYVIFRRAV